jgi:hypothetical protein
MSCWIRLNGRLMSVRSSWKLTRKSCATTCVRTAGSRGTSILTYTEGIRYGFCHHISISCNLTRISMEPTMFVSSRQIYFYSRPFWLSRVLGDEKAMAGLRASIYSILLSYTHNNTFRVMDSVEQSGKPKGNNNAKPHLVSCEHYCTDHSGSSPRAPVARSFSYATRAYIP